MMYEDFCYHMPEEVAEIEGIGYYCADKNGVSDFEGDVVINLTGNPNIPQINIPELAKHVAAPYKEIVVAWPDFSIPRVKPTFWMALHTYIEKQGWKSVCIHCAGGHGRTGTAMAAILIGVAGQSMPNAVGYVRELFCDKAVETPEQCKYLCTLDEYLNKRKTDPKDMPEPSMIICARKAQDKRTQPMSQTKSTAGLHYNVDNEDAVDCSGVRRR